MSKREYLETHLLARAFEVQPSTLSAEAGTVEVVASTGERVRRTGFFNDFDEELVITPERVRLGRLRQVGPVLDMHRQYGSAADVLGVVEDAWVEGGRVLARLRFDLAEPKAANIFRKIQSGILRAVSIGYDAEYERIRAKDRTDGGEVDLFRSTWIEPYEVSVVSMPADQGATFRSAPEGAKRYAIATRSQTEDPMPPENPAPTTAPDPTPDSRAVLEAGLQRVSQTREMLRQLSLDESQAERLVLTHKDDLELRSSILDLVAKRHAATPAVQTEHTFSAGQDQADKRRAAMVAGMAMRMTGGLPKDRRLRGVSVDDNEIQRYRSLSLMDIALEAYEAAGGSERSLRGLSQQERAKVLMGLKRNMNAVSDFPIIANTLVNVTLSQRYTERVSEWKRVARKQNAPNFKPITALQAGDFPPFLAVEEGGTYQRGSTTERDYNIRLKKSGRIFSWTWELMLADDFGLLNTVIAGAANAARRWEDGQFRAKLLANKLPDGTTDFFSVANANINAATGVPSAATLKGAFKKMAAQRGETLPDGEDTDLQSYLVLRPTLWMLGSDDITNAEQLLGGGYVPTGSSGAVTPRMRALANGLIEEPVLDDQSPVFNVLFCDPNELAAVQYGHLDGEDGPVFEQEESFTTDGYDFKGRNAFYVELVEPKAAIKTTRS